MGTTYSGLFTLRSIYDVNWNSIANDNYYTSTHGFKVKVIELEQKVKQCNSCGAVGKINYECEYCGNTVY